MRFNLKYFFLFFLVHIHCFSDNPELKMQVNNSEPSLNPAQRFFGCGEEHEEVIDLDKVPQCNWGEQQQLPSLGEPAEENEQDKDGSKPELEKNENDEIKQQDEREARVEEKNEKENDSEKELEKIIQQLEDSIKECTDEQKLILEETIKILQSLAQEYGVSNFIEATKVYHLTGRKIITGKNILRALGELAQKLQKINSDDCYKTFKFDAAHGNKVTPNSVQEAIAGIACIEQKILKALRRSQHNAEEFIDIENGECWDVKTARSDSIEGEKIFNVNKFKTSLKESIRDGENLIIQITDLNNHDELDLFKILKEEFTKEEIVRMIIIDANDPLRSKSKEELFKFLGK